MRKLQSHVIEQIVKQKNGKCLSEYQNVRSNITLECEFGHIWETKAHNIIHSDSWCPNCANNTKYDIEFANNIALQKGGKCLSKEYVNAHVKLVWECSKGHFWKAKLADIKNKDYWCKICSSKSKGEAKIEDFLIRNNIDFIRQKTFEGCVGVKRKLPFDFYVEEHNLIIEYDGIQHFKPVKRFRGKEGFEITQQNDAIKNAYAKKVGINLVRIPYFEKNIDNILCLLF